MTATEQTVRVRLALSWCHDDQHLVKPLVRKLTDALRLPADVRVEWWQDSHMTCGEDLTPEIVARIGEADYVVAMISPAYFGRPFILEHELPRFAGPTADRQSLPVLLSPLPGFGPDWNLHGIERQFVFTRNSRSFAEQRGVDRTHFANELAAAIRARVLGLNGYRPL